MIRGLWGTSLCGKLEEERGKKELNTPKNIFQKLRRKAGQQVPPDRRLLMKEGGCRLCYSQANSVVTTHHQPDRIRNTREINEAHL